MGFRMPLLLAVLWLGTLAANQVSADSSCDGIPYVRPIFDEINTQLKGQAASSVFNEYATKEQVFDWTELGQAHHEAHVLVIYQINLNNLSSGIRDYSCSQQQHITTGNGGGDLIRTKLHLGNGQLSFYNRYIFDADAPAIDSYVHIEDIVVNTLIWVDEKEHKYQLEQVEVENFRFTSMTYQDIYTQTGLCYKTVEFNTTVLFGIKHYLNAEVRPKLGLRLREVFETALSNQGWSKIITPTTGPSNPVTPISPTSVIDGELDLNRIAKIHHLIKVDIFDNLPKSANTLMEPLEVATTAFLEHTITSTDGGADATVIGHYELHHFKANFNLNLLLTKVSDTYDFNDATFRGRWRVGPSSDVGVHFSALVDIETVELGRQVKNVTVQGVLEPAELDYVIHQTVPSSNSLSLKLGVTALGLKNGSRLNLNNVTDAAVRKAVEQYVLQQQSPPPGAPANFVAPIFAQAFEEARAALEAKLSRFFVEKLVAFAKSP